MTDNKEEDIKEVDVDDPIVKKTTIDSDLLPAMGVQIGAIATVDKKKKVDSEQLPAVGVQVGVVAGTKPPIDNPSKVNSVPDAPPAPVLTRESNVGHPSSQPGAYPSAPGRPTRNVTVGASREDDGPQAAMEALGPARTSGGLPVASQVRDDVPLQTANPQFGQPSTSSSKGNKLFLQVFSVCFQSDHTIFSMFQLLQSFLNTLLMFLALIGK